MKQIGSILSITIAFFALSLFQVFAQTPTTVEQQVSSQYNITFPIVELGNCTDLSSCKAYCNDSSHQQACVDFAKKKGFYKETTLDTQKTTVLQSAKTDLGCDSEETCRQACEKKENFEKCAQFAKRFNLKGGQPSNTSDTTILQRAKTMLGCTSVDSCKLFCQQGENQQKCSNFAKQVGLRGGTTQVGPGGCSSIDSCRAYCIDPSHSQICRQFAPKSGNPSGELRPQVKGPGGCMSEESCRAYCANHPEACHHGDNSVPSNIMSPSPYHSQIVPSSSNQSDDCKMYPDHCHIQTPQGAITNNPPVHVDDPASNCARNNCIWTGGTCVCPSKQPIESGSPIPAQPSTPVVSPFPTVQQVHAAATHKNIMQWLWDYFFLK